MALSSVASIDRSVAVVSIDRWRSASIHSSARRRSSRARSAMATATAMALEDGREGTVRVARASFDSVVDEDEDGSAASAASASASASEEEGDGFSSARDEGDATMTLRSVLTRKPSVAALKALGTLGRGAGSDEEEEGTRARAGTTREGEDEDGVCSLSEFAMVLNAAGWVRDAMGCDANGIEYRVVSRGRGAVEDARTDAYFRARARFVFRAGHGRGGTDERGRDCETTRTFAR